MLYLLLKQRVDILVAKYGLDSMDVFNKYGLACLGYKNKELKKLSEAKRSFIVRLFVKASISRQLRERFCFPAIANDNCTSCTKCSMK